MVGGATPSSFCQTDPVGAKTPIDIRSYSTSAISSSEKKFN